MVWLGAMHGIRRARKGKEAEKSKNERKQGINITAGGKNRNVVMFIKEK